MSFRSWWLVGVSICVGSTAALAQQPAVPAADPLVTVAATENQPPRMVFWPARYEHSDVAVRSGIKLDLTLELIDPEGAPLSVSVFGLPEGARFSEELRALSWTPTPAQHGQHVLRFVVSDGVKQTSRTLRIRVTENHAPRFSEQSHTLWVDRPGTLKLEATDPDLDPLKYSLERGPAGARFNPEYAALIWRPSSDDVGVHEVRVRASDAELSTVGVFSIEVREAGGADSEWQSFLLPGIGYSIYAPRERDTTGTFQGLTLELLIAAWIHRNENRGPSHGRIYLSAEVLDSTEDAVPVLFSYSLGFSLSLERNPRRSFVIPNYGLDLGQIVHDEYGARFHATPYFGIHLFSSPNIFLSTRLGYRLVPSDLENLGGLHAGATFDFSIW